MSSCQSPPDETVNDGFDKDIANRRMEEFRKEFTQELLLCILPKMLLQDDFGSFVDVAYGIDKRKLVAECLRNVASLVEEKYTLEDIAGGLDG